MALGNLAELRTAALGLRTDMASKFSSEILPLAEQRIFYGDGPLQPLRVLPMETSQNLSFTSGSATLPTDFLDKRALYWEGAAGQIVSLSYEPPAVFYQESYNRRGGSFPMAYTVEGNTAKISPALTGTARLLYYQRPAAMSGDTDTNVILAKWPGVYLFSCQIDLYRLLRNDDELTKVRQFYADAVAAANRQALVARTFGGTLKKRVGFGV
ncbi:phage adaptor protein [Hyphomicrobium sp. DMF-1]|jgi:hypothetical protein|uniref:phage adaptor protein n=1 Tax=Hyphomicrobium sp. DMF-1 TaxID=3019544 RepID=UPI0022EC15C2|nr:hypothetical protein [Hyphomicrobium sp. DMF-1]WBT40164.1 hypothetical protein PE058_09860 [Hyphomicrobium sp. DMF-1]